MKIYKAYVEGKNCRISFDGIRRQAGFFTTRVVRGIDAAQAATTIQQGLADELSSMILNEKDDAPEIVLNELSEIDEKTARGIPDAGYRWYPEEHSSTN